MVCGEGDDRRWKGGESKNGQRKKGDARREGGKCEEEGATEEQGSDDKEGGHAESGGEEETCRGGAGIVVAWQEGVGVVYGLEGVLGRVGVVMLHGRGSREGEINKLIII